MYNVYILGVGVTEHNDWIWNFLLSFVCFSSYWFNNI